MKIKLPYGIILTLLALVFTLGLTFASVELPRLVDTFLHENIDFLDVATGQDELTAYKTELFLSHNHIRLIGYICLGIIITLIVTGFVLEKRKLASLGAIFLFLPVFGHFAATMFFLGGLAFLRFLWLPFLDISFDIMRLGDIVLLPYKWILDLTSLTGLNLWKELPFIITGLGLFIFLLGVLAWMYGRMQNKPVTDFWIYRLSRHPVSGLDILELRGALSTRGQYETLCGCCQHPALAASNYGDYCCRFYGRAENAAGAWRILRVLPPANPFSLPLAPLYQKSLQSATKNRF